MFQFLQLFIVVVFLLNASALITSNSYYECSDSYKRCPNGELIYYPFHREDPDSEYYCGYPGLSAKCSEVGRGRPIISLSNHSYYYQRLHDDGVTNIQVVDMDTSDQICPQPRHNFSLGGVVASSLFIIGNNVSYFYNCTTLPKHVSPNLPCIDNNYNSTGRSFAMEDSIIPEGFNWYHNCQESVTIPLHTDSHTINYMEAMKSGILLRLQPSEDCLNCEKSSGKCSYEKNSNTFRCACDGMLLDQICPPYSFKGNVTTTSEICQNCEKSGGKCLYKKSSNSSSCLCEGTLFDKICPKDSSKGSASITSDDCPICEKSGGKCSYNRNSNSASCACDGMLFDKMCPQDSSEGNATVISEDCQNCEKSGGTCSYKRNSNSSTCACDGMLFDKMCPQDSFKGNLTITSEDCQNCEKSGGKCLYKRNSNSSSCACDEMLFDDICPQDSSKANVTITTEDCQNCQKSGGKCLYKRNSNIFNCACDGMLFDEICPQDSSKGNISITSEDCRNCEISGGKCSHDGNSSSSTCTCDRMIFNKVCPQDSSKGNGIPRKENIKMKLIFGFSLGVAVSLLILILIYRRRCSKFSPNNVEVFLQNCGSHALQRYKYSDIKKMTNSFKDTLGQGAFGYVFKGKLLDGRMVAVKLLNESKGDGEEFMNEVATIGRTNHVNVVTLLGFCTERTKRALVYEFMENGSLEKFIYKEKSSTAAYSPALGWDKLYQIALGIARGLEYLHRGCNNRILHFDIKPHNILLDSEFNPKISDFGLAKLSQTRDSIVSMVGTRGTRGYIAPELYCRNFGVVSYKSDVYSYGMVLFEMIGGRKNIDANVENISEIYFPHWIYNHLNKENTIKESKDVQINVSEDILQDEIAKKMIIVALWCIQAHPNDRPSMKMVAEMLEATNDKLQMPPNPSLYPSSSISPLLL